MMTDSMKDMMNIYGKRRTNRVLMKVLCAAFFMLHSSCFISCSDWNDHYDEAAVSTDKIDIYGGDIVSYMKSAADISQISALFEQAGIYDSTYADKQYTFIVSDNSVFNSGSGIADKLRFARYSVSDMAVSPAQLTDGVGIHTRTGKNVWVYGSGTEARLDDYAITKTVKTTNGYVYYIDGMLPIRQSVYEYLQSLDDNYSTFKELVAKYESRVFDKEHSQVTGVNNEGMTTYDSIFVTENSLMDRYTIEGIATWNMRDEQYVTTMFVPSNEQIANAITEALENIPDWLGREATDADREKFEKWIVSASFSDRRFTDDEVGLQGKDFFCVGGYQKIVDTQADITRYKSIDAAYRRPRIQRVNTASRVNLSNGSAYFCTNLKIPNHVVIYRVKSRFYELWNAMSAKEKEQYFRWDHWIDPMIINDCQGEFQLSETLPTMYYHELTAIPDEEAIADSLHCSVEYDGLMYNADDDNVKPCNLPAGEYYLRMGFKHSLTYSVSIYFNDSLLVKDMVLYAQGSNFHFDRGAASEVPHYGEGGIAYGEGFDPDYWMELDPKAIAYDTDGYTVGIVRLKRNGNFKIKIDSYDNSYRYQNTGRNKSNVTQLMMYHWCLRPTINNY